jgi:hypothetical protein
MQAFHGSPAPTSLAICGWTERTPALLRALETRHFYPVAVADRSGAALAAATSALRGRPQQPARYQHPREMLRQGHGALTLIDLEDAADEAAAAAMSGTALLVTGDAIEADTLEMLARTGATTAILRPLWLRAPITAALGIARTIERLRDIIITVEESRPARDIADDLVAFAGRLTGEPALTVTATAYGSQRGETSSIVTEVTFVGGITTLLIARTVVGTHVEVELGSATTAVLAVGDAFGGTLEVTSSGRTAVTPLVEGDRTALAIDDALDELASGGVEADRLFAEAILLRALNTSLEGARAIAPRVAEWDLLLGGGQRSAPRTGHLHLVSV